MSVRCDPLCVATQCKCVSQCVSQRENVRQNFHLKTDSQHPSLPFLHHFSPLLLFRIAMPCTMSCILPSPSQDHLQTCLSRRTQTVHFDLTTLPRLNHESSNLNANPQGAASSCCQTSDVCEHATHRNAPRRQHVPHGKLPTRGGSSTPHITNPSVPHPPTP